MKGVEKVKDESTIIKSIKTEKGKKNRNLFWLLVCGFGGFFSVFTGFILLIVHSILKEDMLFDELGTALIFLSFPMLFLVGYFMDKSVEHIEKK
jgi:uncharacterized membrane protein YhaH (DUF805 family)